MLRSQRFADAQTVAAALLQQYPRHPLALLFAADTADALGDPTAALRHIEAVPPDSPRHSSGRTAQSAAAVRPCAVAREARAAALAAASRLDPDPLQFRALAQVLSDCQDPESARIWLLKALERFPETSAASRRRGARRVPRQPHRRRRGTSRNAAAHRTVSSRARCTCDRRCAPRAPSEITSPISSSDCSANRVDSTSWSPPTSRSPRSTKICSSTRIVRCAEPRRQSLSRHAALRLGERVGGARSDTGEVHGADAARRSARGTPTKVRYSSSACPERARRSSSAS